MSFPLSAPPSEPQSRGHFYWALKGTLSLGFNSINYDRTLVLEWKRFIDPKVPGVVWGWIATLVTRAGWSDFWHSLARFSAKLSFMGRHVPLSGLRVTHRPAVIGRFRRKLLILWDEAVTVVPTMEDVAQRNRCVKLVHVEQRREVALPTRVRAFVPELSELSPNVPHGFWLPPHASRRCSWRSTPAPCCGKARAGTRAFSGIE